MVKRNIMKTEVYGEYQEENTGKIHTVLKVTKEIKHRPLNGRSTVIEDTFEFITDDHIELNITDDEFNELEIVQTGDIIKRVRK